MALMLVKIEAAPPPNWNGDEGDVESDMLVACIERFCVDGLEERWLLMGEVEGEVEEKSDFELDPNDPQDAEVFPVGVEGSPSPSSSSFQEGIEILAVEEENALEEGEVEEVGF